jgi:BASS family bile acid:Na+ symporter
MTAFRTLFRNRNAIFLLALGLGMATPQAAPALRSLVLPCLGLAMTLAALEISAGAFRTPRSLLLPAFLGIIMSYVIMGNVLIGLAALLINDEMLWTGFVLLAGVPPAISIIPFSMLLRGNTGLSLFGTVGAHLGALVILPLITLSLLGVSSFDPLKILLTILILIVIPLTVSRWILERGWQDRIAAHRTPIMNWSFFVVFYTMIGLNRSLIFGRSGALLPVALILICSTFVLGFFLEWVLGLMHIRRETRISLTLLGTMKNQSTAGGLALLFFSQEAALPAAVSTVVMILYVLWLDYRKRRDLLVERD